MLVTIRLPQLDRGADEPVAIGRIASGPQFHDRVTANAEGDGVGDGQTADGEARRIRAEHTDVETPADRAVSLKHLAGCLAEVQRRVESSETSRMPGQQQ